MERPEQSCDCLAITLVLEVGDLHASAYCEKCRHDVWLGRDVPEGPAISRGARPRRPNENAAGLIDDSPAEKPSPREKPSPTEKP